jgi:hypothetical protein
LRAGDGSDSRSDQENLEFLALDPEHLERPKDVEQLETGKEDDPDTVRFI